MEETISRLFLTVLSFSITFSPASSQFEYFMNRKVCQTMECLIAARNLKGPMDQSADPCENFYMYACGNWQKYQRIKGTVSETTFTLRKEENDNEILDFFRQVDNVSEPEAIRKARKLFSLCVKEDTSAGVSQIVKILQKIGVRDMPFDDDKNRSDDFDYTTVLARANKLAGKRVYFNFGVMPNPYNQTENLIALTSPSWLNMDESITPMARATGEWLRRHKLLRNSSQYKHHTPSSIDVLIQVRKYINRIVMVMCENSTSEACLIPNNKTTNTSFDRIIDKIIQLNEDLPTFMETSAIFLPTNSSSPDIGIYSLHQFQTLSDNISNEVNTNMPKLNWTRYLEELFSDLDNVTLNLSDPNKVQIIVQELDFHLNILRFVYTYRTDLISIERDIWWQVVTTLIPYVDLGISEARKFLKTDGGFYPNRENRCVAVTAASFGMTIYYSYSTKKRHIDAKTKMAEMLEHVRESFQETIQRATWMDDETKGRAIMKLKSLKTNIGFPNITDGKFNMDDLYHDVNVTDNFLDTMISKIQIEVKKKLRKLDQLNNLDDDFWTPPNIVNGFYLQDRNSIVIPSGLIGGSFYTGSLRAVDYGAIGSVLGHELSHALDDSGRHFNEIGNIENWWQNETLNKYDEKVNCFVEVYANYNITVGNGTTLYGDVQNSITSLDENISDNVGFKQCLLAYRKSVSKLGEEDSLTQFETFTNEQLLTLAYANVLCEDPTWTSLESAENHSPNIIRVNGVFRNSKEFSYAWRCPKGTGMNPYKQCSIW